MTLISGIVILPMDQARVEKKIHCDLVSLPCRFCHNGMYC
jgi:hypothetical protein